MARAKKKSPIKEELDKNIERTTDTSSSGQGGATRGGEVGVSGISSTTSTRGNEGTRPVGPLRRQGEERPVPTDSEKFAEIASGGMGEPTGQDIGGEKFKRGELEHERRDTLTGSTAGGLGGVPTRGGIVGAGLGGTFGSSTGEGTRAVTPGGWEGTDDATSTSESDTTKDRELGS